MNDMRSFITSQARIAASSLLVVAWVSSSVPAIALADSRAIRADYPVTKLSDRVYVIYGPTEGPNKTNQGFRNNPSFVLTKAGVVVVDPGGTVYAGQMVLDKIRSITQAPVVAVFDTHIHGTHWLGNQAIKQAFPNAVIYAHPNMKAQAEAGEGDRWVEIMNDLTGGAAEGTRPVGPDKTVDNGDVLKIGDRRFRIYYGGPAHTDGDIAIEVVEEKLLLTGDIVRNGHIGPWMKSFKGSVAAIDMALKVDAEIIVPGHGESGSAVVARVYQRFLTTLLDTVKTLYEKGLSDFEMKFQVIEALTDYKDWSGFDRNLGRLISLAYLEVEAEAF